MQPQATMTPPSTEEKTEPAAAANAPAQPAGPAPTAPAKAGYGKRPMWQWILIYVVLAAIVYGIIYYVWIRKTGSGSTY